LLTVTTPDVADNNLRTVFYNVADLPAFRRANGKTVPNYDKLIDVITESVKPTTWSKVGGCGSILEYDAANVQVLVILQTEEVHEQIADLLGRLRKLHQGPLTDEEIESLPPEPQPKPRPHAPPTGGPQQPRGPMGGMGGAGGRRTAPNDPFNDSSIPATPAPEPGDGNAPGMGGMGMF
jgi:hypothetical protein